MACYTTLRAAVVRLRSFGMLERGGMIRSRHMKSRLVIVTALGLVCLSLAAHQRSTPQRGIQGVWRVVEQTINDQTLKAPALGEGFHIYTAGHYAVVRETGNSPRPDVSNTNTATADQLRAVWGPFVAQLGTYEISGDILTERTLVAKHPSNMVNTGSSRRRFKLDGNTMTTEPYEPTAGRSIKLKMIRVE
jgi:hypothetical protein